MKLVRSGVTPVLVAAIAMSGLLATGAAAQEPADTSEDRSEQDLPLEGFEGNRLFLNFHTTGFDLGKIQDVIDQIQ